VPDESKVPDQGEPFAPPPLAVHWLVPVEDQVSVSVCPCVTVVALADRIAVGSATVSFASAVVLP
jgi:hypothetical protein